MKSTFAGCLDVANREGDEPLLMSNLCFLGLFSERIIVPDSYFFCKGLVWEHSQKVIEKYNIGGKISDELKKEIWDSDLVNKNLLLRMIKEGIIVPACRTKASSLYENFINKNKVDYNSNYISDLSSGVLVVRLIDCLREYQNDLDKESPLENIIWEDVYSLRTFYGLEKIYLKSDDEAKNIDEVCKNVSERMGIRIISDKNEECKKLLIEWIDCLRKTQRRVRSADCKEKFFQRGPTENVLKKVWNAQDKELFVKMYGGITGGEKNKQKQVHETNQQKLAKLLSYDLILCYQIGQGTALADSISVSPSIFSESLDDDVLRAISSEKNVLRNKTDHIYNDRSDYEIFSKIDGESFMKIRNNGFVFYKNSLMEIGNEGRCSDIREKYIKYISKKCFLKRIKVKDTSIDSMMNSASSLKEVVFLSLFKKSITVVLGVFKLETKVTNSFDRRSRFVRAANYFMQHLYYCENIDAE